MSVDGAAIGGDKKAGGGESGRGARAMGFSNRVYLVYNTTCSGLACALLMFLVSCCSLSPTRGGVPFGVASVLRKASCGVAHTDRLKLVWATQCREEDVGD